MPQITQIKPQKNNKRVNIYLDGRFGFGLDLENYVKLGLKVEQVLTEKEIEDIVKKAEFQKTLDKVLKYSMLRPRSEKEIEGWFKRKKVHQSLQKELFDRLNHFELIDDKKFAEWWIWQRLQFKSKSKRDLENELRYKGIDKNTIDDVLAEIEIDEFAAAKKLLEKKKFKWRGLNDEDTKRKMAEYLARKGFGWDVIKKVTKAEIDG